MSSLNTTFVGQGCNAAEPGEDKSEDSRRGRRGCLSNSGFLNFLTHYFFDFKVNFQFTT